VRRTPPPPETQGFPPQAAPPAPVVTWESSPGPARPNRAAFFATALLCGGAFLVALFGLAEFSRAAPGVLPRDPSVPLALALLLAGALAWARQETGRAVAGGTVALGVAAAALLGAGAALLYRALGDVLPFPEEAGVVLAAASGAAALLVVLRAAARNRRDGLAAFLSGSASRFVYLIVVVASYLALRPRLAGTVEHMDLWEYGVGLAIASFLLARYRAFAGSKAPEKPWASVAVRHVGQSRPIPDRRWLDVDATVGAFVERGEARERYRDLVLAALSAGRAPASASMRVRERIESYEDLPPPRFLRTRRRLRALASRNRARRLTLHREILSTVGGGVDG